MSRLSSSEVAQIMAPYLLKGWTMLEDVCATKDCEVPLLEDSEGKRLCVRCDLPSDKSQPQQPKKNPIVPDAKSQPPNQKSEGDEADGRKQKKQKMSSSEVSLLVSQKLLQGWALLQECCPGENCAGVPLLRDREKKMNCVSCGLAYIKAEDFDPTKHTIAPKSQPPPPTPSPTVSEDRKLAAEAFTSSKITQSPREVEKKPRNYDGLALSSDLPPPPQSQTQTASKGYTFHFNYDEGERYFKDAPEDEESEDEGLVDEEELLRTTKSAPAYESSFALRESRAINHAMGALLGKLEKASSMLAKTQDPVAARSLCELISSTAEALKTVKNLKN